MGLYIWTAIHDVTYTTPPGYMSFEDDWGINFDYDPVTNPDPADNLIFLTEIVPTPRATRSLKWDEPYYYDLGYLWLRPRGIFLDPYYRSPLVFETQLHYRSEFRRISPTSTNQRTRDTHTGIELNFNTAFCSSVILRAYPPPTWVD